MLLKSSLLALALLTSSCLELSSNSLTARIRPIGPPRPDPKIYRIDANRCGIYAPDAVSYTQGGVKRSITAVFICSKCFLVCHPEWGDGTRQIAVDYIYPSGIETFTIQEVWPK